MTATPPVSASAAAPCALHPLNPALGGTFAPPVMEARRWLEGVEFPPERPLINVSQAAPVEAPPLALREAIARAALEDPQAQHLGLTVEDPDGPHGRFRTIRSPVSFDGERATTVTAPPVLGQHNDEILGLAVNAAAAFGFDLALEGEFVSVNTVKAQGGQVVDSAFDHRHGVSHVWCKEPVHAWRLGVHVSPVWRLRRWLAGRPAV